MVDIFQVDSFTTERFKGNPAGVCVLDEFPILKVCFIWLER